MKFQMFKLDLEKAEEPEIKLTTSAGSSKKQERLRRGGRNTQKNYTEKVFMTRITMMVWSLT